MRVLICQTLVAHPLDVIKTRLQGKAHAQLLYHDRMMNGDNLAQSIGSLVHALGVRCDWYKDLSTTRGLSTLSTGVLHLISSAIR